MTDTSLGPSVEIKRLKWRCRRGMRELDVLLTSWLEAHYANADPTTQRHFMQLLEQEDDLLWDWLLGRSAPSDAELKTLVAAIGGTAPQAPHT